MKNILNAGSRNIYFLRKFICRNSKRNKKFFVEDFSDCWCFDKIRHSFLLVVIYNLYIVIMSVFFCKTDTPLIIYAD